MAIQSYDHPALTADVVLFALSEGSLSVLLVQRGRPPFEGAWAFPGGFVDVGEAPPDAAARELEEETGIQGVELEQLRAFGDPDRDPRGHVVSVVYVGLAMREAMPPLKADSDAEQARWWPLSDLPTLAFDHAKIMAYALDRLGTAFACTPPQGLSSTLPDDVSLGDLRAACSVVADMAGKLK